MSRCSGAGYLSPAYTTPQQQEQALLNNAVSEAGTLGLQAGVALTQAQVAALTQDIVWDVPEVVNGETVLVPQLYLAAGDAAKVESGASEIAGANVSLSAANIANTGGVIAASNNLDLAATGSITNTEGTLSAGGDLSVVAGNDIAASASTLGSLSLAAGNDITLQSLVNSSDSESSGHKSGFFSSKSWIDIDDTETLATTGLSATGAIRFSAESQLDTTVSPKISMPQSASQPSSANGYEPQP